jgi:hypothetical protein
LLPDPSHQALLEIVMNTLRITKRALAVGTLGLAAPLLLAGTAAAQSATWTTTGSAGTVDEADLGIVNFANAEARLMPGAAAGSVLNVRYNVVSLAGFSGPGQYVMRVRFQDNGDAARVQLALRRHNLTGTTSTLANFDSNTFPAQVGYQNQQRCVGINWDFGAGPHYIEATLTKSAAGGQPGLAFIQLIPANCTP